MEITTNSMRKILLLILLCGLLSAQSVGPISITSTSCASIATDQKATVAFQVTGSWSGTIQPQAAVDGQAAFNVQVTPPSSSTAQSTVTANGAYIAAVSGYNFFQVCGATVTGTAKVYLNVSPVRH